MIEKETRAVCPLETGWTLGWSDGISDAPLEWAPAWTPSDVQLVWKAFKDMPDYNFGKNYLEYRWMEDKFWHYRIRLTPEDRPGYTPTLVFQSIDYRYTVLVNGGTAADGEGMFTPVRIDLSPFAGKETEIEAILHPVPKAPGAPEGRAEASRSVKPPVSYGWDWHPRLVPSGLSDAVFLEYLPVSHIEEADFQYTLSDALDAVDFTAALRVCRPAPDMTLSVALLDGEETVACAKAPAAESVSLRLHLDRPKLWWCRGQGAQHRYLYRAVLLGPDGEPLDDVSRPVGFRRAALVMNAESWYSGGGYPMTQAVCPITLELNGRRIFCKGSNLVPTEIFYSRMTPAVYARIVSLADACGMNILRVWGGGLVNRESFFDACDAHGVMVWQEFPLACNNYPDDPHYLRVLERESASIVDRVKGHPSLVMWCGGNELFNGWSGMTNQSLALRLLDKICLERDPWTPFLMTSPLYGMGHGSYLNINLNGEDAVTDFIQNPRTAYTEFGAPAPAPLDYVRQYLPEEELYDVRPGSAWESHHAFRSWLSLYTWYRPEEIEAFYGRQPDLETRIACGLELQGQSYKGMFEEARRKWPRTSMALNWCFNEPWPCFANNSLVMYPNLPRPAYYDVRESLRDRMVSVRTPRLRFLRGEEAVFELFLLNDLPEPMPAGRVRLTLETPEETVCLGAFSYPETAPCSASMFGKAVCVMPASSACVLTLRADAEDGALSSSYKLFLVERRSKGALPFPK